MQLTETQVLELAPDASAAKAGRDLGKPEKWVSLGRNAEILWGEIRGSGKDPYRTQADIGRMAFKCSCPSRKFPCKHGLGLLLCYAVTPGNFIEGTPPAWVQEWLDRHQARQEKQAEKQNDPVALEKDEAAKRKRADSRMAKVQSGMAELQQWLKDRIREGLLPLPEQSAHYWQSPAARMVDAQAPGLAARLRDLGNVNHFAEGWQEQVLHRLCNMYLITEALGRIDTLAQPLQEEVRSQVGFTVKQDELKEQSGLRDHWCVLAVDQTEEDRLIVERAWLFGKRHGQFALILRFFHRSQAAGMEEFFLAGTVTDAELVYFPGALPMRALVKDGHNLVDNKLDELPGLSVDGMFAARSEVLAASPWIDRLPFILEGVRAVATAQGKWLLADSAGEAVPLADDFDGLWKMLALTGGHPVNIFGTWQDGSFRPLGIWAEEGYVTV